MKRMMNTLFVALMPVGALFAGGHTTIGTPDPNAYTGHRMDIETFLVTDESIAQGDGIPTSLVNQLSKH